MHSARTYFQCLYAKGGLYVPLAPCLNAWPISPMLSPYLPLFNTPNSQNRQKSPFLAVLLPLTGIAMWSKLVKLGSSQRELQCEMLELLESAQARNLDVAWSTAPVHRYDRYMDIISQENVLEQQSNLLLLLLLLLLLFLWWWWWWWWWLWLLFWLLLWW